MTTTTTEASRWEQRLANGYDRNDIRELARAAWGKGCTVLEDGCATLATYIRFRDASRLVFFVNVDGALVFAEMVDDGLRW